MTTYKNAGADGEIHLDSSFHHRSELSKIIWKTYGSEHIGAWVNGQIVYRYSQKIDPPYMPGFPEETDGNLVAADWIKQLISLIDKSIPSTDQIIECLDDDILTIRSGPAFYMPTSPNPKDAAWCLLASRVLARCSRDVIPPFLVSNERAEHWFHQVSIMSLMLGGEEAFLLATELAQNPRSYAIIPSRRIDPILIADDHN